MARTKEFDPDIALERALGVFWEKGYEATSIADLVTATGVQRQSIYDTFGDKHGLFRAALDRYAARYAGAAQALRDPSGGASPLGRLQRVFRMVADEAEPGNRGCMLISSAVERGRCDDMVVSHARAAVASLEKALVATIREAQDAREVPPGVNPRAAARVIVTLVWGLRAMGRAIPDRAWQRSVVDGALGLVTAH